MKARLIRGISTVAAPAAAGAHLLQHVTRRLDNGDRVHDAAAAARDGDGAEEARRAAADYRRGGRRGGGGAEENGMGKGRGGTGKGGEREEGR